MLTVTFAVALAGAADVDSQSDCRRACWQENYECMESARQGHEECLAGCTWADPWCQQGCYDYFHWSRRWCAHQLADCVSACEADGCPWWCGPDCWFCVSGVCDGEATP